MFRERSSGVRALVFLLPVTVCAIGCGEAAISTTSSTGTSSGQGGSGGQGTTSGAGGQGASGATTSAGGSTGSGGNTGSGGAAPTKAVASWSKHFGDEADQSGEFVGVSAAGNVIIAGKVDGSIDLGGGVLTALQSTSYDFFVAAFGPDGSPLWSRVVSSPSFAFLADMAVSPSGEIALAGGFFDALDFGAGPLAGIGQGDAFVAKLSADGALLWASARGAAQAVETGTAVAIDASGAVLLAGIFNTTTDVGAGPLVSAGANDVFLARYGAAGEALSSRRFGSTAADYAIDLKLDPSGDLLLLGAFGAAIDIGGQLLPPAKHSTFVAKLSPSGDPIWAKAIGAEGMQGPRHHLAVDGAGNLLLAGSFDVQVSLGGETLLNDGPGQDVYIARWSPSGAHLFSKSYSGSGVQEVNAADVDAAGNLYVAGVLNGPVDLGNGILDPLSVVDSFVARFDPSGNLAWAEQHDSLVGTYALAVGPSSEVVIAGTLFGGVTDFGDGAHVAKADDAFVARLLQE